MINKTFALVDCNNFYCSCERLFRPDLKKKPVAVLSNNDGCIIARSQEVKDLGIKMGTPYFKAKELIQQHGIQIFSSNYRLYGDISSRVMQTLEEMSPHVEIYSIDEAFLDLSGSGDLMGYGQQVKRQVYQYVGVPVSVGIAPTKTLAKLANYAAKKFKQTGGVVDLTDQQRQKKLLAITPVSEVWGVGRRHAASLNQLGVTTALQLAQMHVKFAYKRYSVVMERTVRELNGESCLDLEEITSPKKQIVCSRSFGEKITEYLPLRQAICEFAARATEKLRQEQQRALNVTVFIRTSPFQPTAPFHSNAATGTLAQASHNTRDILHLSMRLFDAIWKDGYHYAKGGIMLGDFCPEDQIQFSLFHPQKQTEQTDQLMQTLDSINHGLGSIWFGGQRPKKDWFMTQAKLSPAYTTRWECLPALN